MNIICLHGFTQNKDIFNKKLSKLFNYKNLNINMHFIEGSYSINNDGFGWWIMDKENVHNINTNLDATLYNFDESINKIKQYILDNNLTNKNVGLIGFSQGACLVDYLCKSQILDITIKFAIFIGGFSFDYDILPNKIKNVNIPSLHIYGIMDTVVSNKESFILKLNYKSSNQILHKKGHIIPSDSYSKTSFFNFIKVNIE